MLHTSNHVTPEYVIHSLICYTQLNKLYTPKYVIHTLICYTYLNKLHTPKYGTRI